MISMFLSSIFFSLLCIFPTKLTTPITTLRPILINNYFFNKSNITTNNNSNPYPVTFAYLISATKGDVPKLKRLLYALYHPGNYYLIHLESGAPEREHRALKEFVGKEAVFGQVGNVWIVGKSNLVTYRGPTMLSTTLHGMAILLRLRNNWDWFINLSASDYPLVSQDGMVSEKPLKIYFFFISWVFSYNFFEICVDLRKNMIFFFLFYFVFVSDLIHAFSELPRDLNFIQHSSHLGWKL